MKNEIIFISDETIGKFNVIPASEKSTTNFIIPGMQKLCKLSNKEKYQNNGCFSFNDCDNTKYEFCFDNNLGAICQNNYIYGNLRYESELLNKIKLFNQFFI